MVRSVTVAAILGALIAAGIACALCQSAWRNVVAAQPGEPERPGEASRATEDWPICTTMVSFGSDTEGLDFDFAAAKKALAAGNWNATIAALKLAALRDPRNADIQNYIGYAHLRLRDRGRRCSIFSDHSRSTVG